MLFIQNSNYIILPIAQQKKRLVATFVIKHRSIKCAFQI